jgi:hypothetical protein
MTRQPKAWSLSAEFVGKGTLISKLPRIRNEEGELLQEGPRDKHGRLLAAKGRPPNFDAAVLQRLQAALETFLLDRKASLGRLPLQKDRLMLEFIRERMVAEGLESSDRIIARQVISPVFKKLAKKGDRKPFGH